MEPTAEAIMQFAAQRARATWDERQEPYMLARLSPELASEGINYKDVLGAVRLKDFFQGAGGGVRVVVHPTQKAKVGIVPADIEFDFPAEATVPPRNVSEPEPGALRNSASRRRYIVSNFLGLLAELDEGDAAQVQIPTVILTKLLREK